jgi:predicted Rossmann fold nucleotide-binding protein DprA/Smf involved in DNA uptake
MEPIRRETKASEVAETSEASCVGNPDLFGQPLLGIFASVKCPARLILAAHDAAGEISAQGKSVISGFQSPVEKEMLEVLLRGPSPIIICPARGLEGMRIPAAWRPKLANGLLLVISPFPAYIKRPRPETVLKRNQLVAQLASELLIVHADPGGKVEKVAQDALSNRKVVRWLESQVNEKTILR